MRKETVSVVAMGCILVIAQLVAIALAAPFSAVGYQAFENPDDPYNAAFYVALILVFTGIILLIVKYGRGDLLKYVVLVAMAITMWFVFYVPTGYLILFISPGEWTELHGWIATIGSLGLAAGLTLALFIHPEWYVVDATGIAVSAGVMAILGISFGILPALLLLIALAIYDAISVYKTKHMVTLADAVTQQRLPILLVIPKTLRYSFRAQRGLKEQIEKGEEREAIFMGLGDIIIPGILAVSAFSFLAQEQIFWTYSNLVVAISTLLGSLLGFVVLMRFVLKGNPQAGLPLLNSGAILGYIISYLAIYRDVSLGISLSF